MDFTKFPLLFLKGTGLLLIEDVWPLHVESEAIKSYS